MQMLKAIPYFAGFFAILNDHVAPDAMQIRDRDTGQLVGYKPGVLNRSCTVSISLHRENNGKTITPAAKEYVFASEPTTKTTSHNGMPSVDSILTESVNTAYVAAIDEFAAVGYPALVGNGEDAKNGVKLYARLDSIRGQMPAGKPAEFYVTAFFGLYEDELCTRQIEDGGIALSFVSKEYVIAKAFGQGVEATEAQIAEVRAANSWHDLAALLENVDVQVAVKTMAGASMAALVGTVHNWSGFDVAAWGDEFSLPSFS